VGVVDGDSLEDADPLLRVGGAAVVPEGRDTAILATGTVDAAALAAVLRRLAAADVAVGPRVSPGRRSSSSWGGATARSRFGSRRRRWRWCRARRTDISLPLPARFSNAV